jgi:septal ring factor EnvC (AmiA/AmiB activator)
MRRRMSLAWLCFAGIALASPLAHSAEDISKAKRDINGITKRLNDLDAWFSDASRRQRNLQKDLRTTDQSIAATNSDIRRIEAEQKRITTELAALDEQRSALAASRDAQAQLISNHLAAAYRLSGEDFLKLLLNQQSPELSERMLRYHGYFSAARTETLADYQATLTAIEANAAEKQAREQELAQKQTHLDADQAELRTKRQARERVLVALKGDMQDKAAQRSRLKQDRDRLQSLVAELQRRAQGSVATTFARSKGKLPWPALGKLKHRFGEGRSGGLLKWQGIVISAPEGAKVAAVHSGRVAFSDWLRGFGLLTIVDHGSGYMSLYAHSDVLYKEVGDKVAAGETIATAGRSGGQSASGVYFEIRSKGVAINPLTWLSKR